MFLSIWYVSQHLFMLSMCVSILELVFRYSYYERNLYILFYFMDKEELRVKKKIEVNMRKHKHKIGIIKEFQTIPSLEI